MRVFQAAAALFVCLLLAACGGAAPTETPAPTATDTPVPSATPSPTLMPTVTLTPSITPTLPPTQPPTATPPPTITPQPVTGLTYDNWDFVEAPANIMSLLNSQLVAFVNTNNRDAVLTPGTPQPGNDRETLYYISPSGGTPITILEMTAATGDQVFVAPSGSAIAYMRQEGNPSSDGFYVIDLTLDTPIRGRILPIDSLIQRGIYSEPSWSPDGSRLAMALETGYNLDIFTIGRDGSAPTNLTQHPSNDFWPQWSPDGGLLAFVSDRSICPSWTPGDANACDPDADTPPAGGFVYVMDPSTMETRQLSEQWVTEPPVWVNPRQIAYASGDPLFGDPERSLWIADVITGEAREVQLASGDDPIKLAAAWSPNGSEVLYQAADTSTALVMAGIDGREIGRTSDLTFTRYGLSADWAPNGNAVAIGGIEGQCPYGIVVVSAEFDSIARGNPPPSMCEPQYSPDGALLAFTGVNPRIDGRVDVYVANANGFGGQNLTANLRGNIRLLGWVGGS